MRPELIRRCIRYALAGFGVLALATALAVILLHFWGVQRLEKARSEFESRWGDLAGFETPPDVPGQANAGRWLVAGGQAIVCSMEDQRFFGRMAERPAHGWTEAELARVRWILHEQQPALELLLRSARFDDFHLGRNGLRVHHEEVEVMNIVKGLRLLVLEARLAHVDDRVGDAVAALTTVGRAADGLLRTPTVTTWIIGSAPIQT